GWCRDESGLLLPWMRSLGPRSVRVPTVAGLSRMGMKIYTVGARRMPSYFRVVYHQKWPRTHKSCQTTIRPISGFIGLASCGSMGSRIVHSLWLIEVDPHRGGSISLRP